MTYKDKVLQEHPEAADPYLWGGVKSCPSDYGYDNDPRCAGSERHYACKENCTACWNREIPEEGHTERRTINEVVSVLAGPHILDSGNRREFGTGAVRDIQEGKGRCDLMPLDVVAAHLGDDILYNIYDFELCGETHHLMNALDKFAMVYGVRGATKPIISMYLDVSKHFEEGAKKYGENNWQKGIPAYCYIDSAVRHYLKFCAGWEDEPHDRAFVWNLMCCIWTCKHKPELNTYAADEKNI